MTAHNRQAQRFENFNSTNPDSIKRGEIKTTSQQVREAYFNLVTMTGCTGHLNAKQKAKVIAARKAAGLC